LYKRPRTRFVAEFFRGCNVLQVAPLRTANGRWAYRLAGVLIEAANDDGADASRTHIAVRSEDLHIGAGAETRSLRVVGTLVESAYRGTVLEYLVELGDGQRLVATTTRRASVSPGSAVTVGFEPNVVIPVLED
jgi:ABC-type Fe3+/spermidine/putrescine transport system ATPase subunit